MFRNISETSHKLAVDRFVCHKEWDNATKIQKAFQIGSKEAAAVSNLKDRISPAVVAQLREDVRSRGMNKWISHEVISRDVFNRGFSSGVGIFESWSEPCTNAADDELATWLK